MTPMQIFWVLLAIGALVAFYFGIRAQMRRGDTLAGPVVPSDPDSPDIHPGEGKGEKVADEYESMTNTLGHG